MSHTKVIARLSFHNIKFNFINETKNQKFPLLAKTNKLAQTICIHFTQKKTFANATRSVVPM